MNKRGISSYSLAANIGVTQKTAWFLLQRIRKVLGNEPIPKLQGIVELDETFVGGKNRFRHHDKKIKYDKGRTWKDKVPVFGMLERGGKVVAIVIRSPSKRVIFPLVYKMIHQGTTLMCDEFKAYKKLQNNYGLEMVNHSSGVYGKDGWISTNGMENFWSNLKRHIKGTHIKVAPKHLNKYVNESVFRYNYRNFGVQQQIDQALKYMSVRLTYKELTKAA
jgi:transposase-like protein